VMDEVDAPLDESNIYRFIRLLQEFKDQTQFIVITHNARTIEAGDWIYGVTMEEPGVSRIVGVRLEDALRVSGSVA
jgi:chromosome segregation protein